MTSSLEIKTVEHPRCPVCKQPGSALYKNLKDRFFNVPGEWHMKKCADKKCGTLWLDPAPQESDLDKMYVNYSTHKDTPFPEKTARKRSLLDRIRESYLHKKYQYGRPPNSFIDKLLWVTAYMHPAWKDTQAANVFYLPYVKNGLLLDVGCGSGSAMEDMRKKGWRVLGIDFDQDAIENAKRKGLDARHGDLFSQAFPNDSFDAILLNHVIEHIPSPDKLFGECRRILKPGGTLVMITPNAHSRGHAKYGRNWRGLETPHHVHIFTPRSLAMLAQDAGFSKRKSFSSLQGIFYILGQSEELEREHIIDVYSSSYAESFAYKPLMKHLRWLALGWMHALFPDRDEVAVVLCRK